MSRVATVIRIVDLDWLQTQPYEAMLANVTD